MAIIVAIHGAMHGGWAWGPVRRILARRGHDVYTPSLTGQGDRAHLLVRSVGVETHITDITSLISMEALSDVVLVFHSYAGILAGPVVDRCQGRIRSVVLAGAFYVRPGQSLLDVEPPAVAQAYRQQARTHGDGWRLPATDAYLTQWAITDPTLQNFVRPRLVDFPFKAQTDVVEFDPEPMRALPRWYIEHTSPPLGSLRSSIEMAVADGFRRTTIATGHDMMLAEPIRTADLLESLL
jgi:pimeloyl-ACP methyl ester carboxylesterase